MSLHYIIDGYNTINHPSFIRARKPSQDERFALLSLIRRNRLTGSPKNKVTVVFDGYPDLQGRDLGEPGLAAVYSRNISADEKIKMLVEERAERKSIIVVSDDKEIKYAVKLLGAKALGVDEFFLAKEKTGSFTKKEPLEPGLNFTQMQKINEELSKLWLKE